MSYSSGSIYGRAITFTLYCSYCSGSRPTTPVVSDIRNNVQTMMFCVCVCMCCCVCVLVCVCVGVRVCV